MKTVMISVVMAVYNGEQYLEEAIDSMIGQTYEDWEMIIVDDASTDATGEILKRYEAQDPRIRVLTNTENQKLPASLNYGIQAAKGTYILRMDADDVCRKDRFEKQVAYMEKHTDVMLSWGLGVSYCNGSVQKEVITYSVSYEKLKALLLFFCPVYHNCIIAKRELFEEFSYQPEFTISEDWRLWSQIVQKGKMQGVRDYFVLYRTHDGQASNIRNRDIQKNQVEKTLRDMHKGIGFQVSEEDIACQVELIFGNSRIDGRQFLGWARRMIKQNRACGWCKTGDFQYGLMWKLDDLYRSRRISGVEYCSLCCKISPWGFLLYWGRKLITAALDVCYRQAAKRKFA